MKIIHWLAGAALLIGTQAGLAQERFYLGVGAGSSDIDRGITEGLITSGTVDGGDSGTKIFGGYRFSRNLALEIAWTDLGKLKYSGDFFGTPVTNGQAKVSGLNTSLVLLHPAMESLDIFAKVGLHSWEAKARDTTGGLPFSGKVDGTDLSFGLGAEYAFMRNVAARLEWEHFELDPDAASLLSASLVVRF